MPIDKRNLVCTCGFQNNCAVNCLAHRIICYLDNIPEQAINRLYQSFLNYYELQTSNLEIAKLLELLKAINNPIRLEVVLGLVLRNMLANKERHNSSSMISDEEVSELANRFDIRVEFYANIPAVQQSSVFTPHGYLFSVPQQPAPTKNGSPIPVLKFWRVSSPPHWEYEELDTSRLTLHNQHYNEESRCIPREYIYDVSLHQRSLKELISINLKQANKNLDETLSTFEKDIKSGVNPNKMLPKGPNRQSIAEFSQHISKLREEKVAFF